MVANKRIKVNCFAGFEAIIGIIFKIPGKKIVAFKIALGNGIAVETEKPIVKILDYLAGSEQLGIGRRTNCVRYSGFGTTMLGPGAISAVPIVFGGGETNETKTNQNKGNQDNDKKTLFFILIQLAYHLLINLTINLYKIV